MQNVNKIEFYGRFYTMDCVFVLPTGILLNILDFVRFHASSYPNFPPALVIEIASSYSAIELFALIREDLRDYCYSYYMQLATCYNMRQIPMQLACFHTKASDILTGYMESVLFKFLAKDPSYVIAGGFPTQLWCGLTPAESSDIDVFVLGDNGAIERLVQFIGEHGVEQVADKNGVFSFAWPEFAHRVELIWINHCSNPHELLMEFDLSYCKCFIHRGKLQAAPDAAHSLKTRKCLAYHMTVLKCRALKALRYCDRIINLPAFDPTVLDECHVPTEPKIVALADLELQRVDFQYSYDRNNTHKQFLSPMNAAEIDICNPKNPNPGYLERIITGRILPKITLKYEHCFEHIPEDCKEFYSRDPRIHQLYRYWQTLPHDKCFGIEYFDQYRCAVRITHIETQDGFPPIRPLPADLLFIKVPCDKSGFKLGAEYQFYICYNESCISPYFVLSE